MSLKNSFIVTKADFSRVLASVGKFVSSTPPLDVIDLLFIKDIIKSEARERLFLTAFNGEAGIKAIMPATSNGDFPGQSARTGGQPITIGIKAGLLAELVSTLDGEINIGLTEDNKVQVQAGKSRSRLNCIIGPTLPEISVPNARSILSVTGKVLRSLSRVIDFSSRDAARASLQSILFEVANGEISAYAADGYGAAYVTEKAESKEEVSLLISNAGNFVSRLTGLVSNEDVVSVMASADNRRVIFGIKEAKSRKAMMLSVPTMDISTFPSGQLRAMFAVSQKGSRALIDGKNLMLAARQVSVMDPGRGCARLQSRDGQLHVLTAYSTETGMAHNILQVKSMQGEFDVVARATQIIKIMEAAAGESEVHFACSGDKQPLHFHQGSYQAVIMPMVLEGAAVATVEETETVPA